MLVNLNDIVRVTVHGLGLDGQAIQNSYTMRNVGGNVVAASALEDFVDILEDLYALLSAFLSIGLVIQKITAINLTQQLDVGTGVFVDSTPGTNSSTVFPPQCAMGLNLSTDRLRVRGRKFFGLVTEDAADNAGVLTAAAILDLADVGNWMTANRVGINSTWQFGVKATSDGVFLPFTSYSVPVTVVTQRRRRRGVGG